MSRCPADFFDSCLYLLICISKVILPHVFETDKLNTMVFSVGYVEKKKLIFRSHA